MTSGGCLNRRLRRFSQMGYDAPLPFVPGFWMDVPSAEAPACAGMTVGVDGLRGWAVMPRALSFCPYAPIAWPHRLRHFPIVSYVVGRGRGLRLNRVSWGLTHGLGLLIVLLRLKRG